MLSWLNVQATLFVAASAALVAVSRKPLRHPRSHGFYRFFAWEAITALVALNLPVWFRAPFSLPQLASWVLLVGSAYLVLHAVTVFRAVGRAEVPGPAASPGGARRSSGDAHDANYAFENTSRLVRVGPYRFIRHPMYASLLYLAWGVYLKDPASRLGAGLALVASLLLWLTAHADEEECKRVFGPEYERYVDATRRFIPYIV